MKLWKWLKKASTPAILGRTLVRWGVRRGSASAGRQWTGPSDFDHDIMENGRKKLTTPAILGRALVRLYCYFIL
jgi:hypothetical protein